MSATVRDLFDAMAPAYHRLEPWYEHLYAVLHGVMSAELGAPAVPGGRALDAGCGTGFQTTVLAERGWRAHGLDIASSLLLLARDRVPRATLACGDIEALPYAAASFDAAVCCGSTLSFVEHPGRALAELGRVLRPGGVLFLECEHRPSLDLGWALASALTGNALGYDLSLRQAWRALVARGSVRVAYPGYGALHLFTRHHLHTMLESAGLAPRREWGVHSITNALPSTLLHRDRLPRPLAALYRALCRLDTALAPTRAGRALGNSLVILAERAQSSA